MARFTAGISLAAGGDCWQECPIVNPPDDIDWVRHVNGRWIVRESLRGDTSAYLDHLASVDPVRLREACGRARGLRRFHPDEDPKPWFYAGLFSLATQDEAARFLKGHDFTIACIPKFAKTQLGSLSVEDLVEETAEKIRRIREELDRLPDPVTP